MIFPASISVSLFLARWDRELRDSEFGSGEGLSGLNLFAQWDR